jgi:ABC-type uncharacterized transport system substrate-binding protein
LIITFSTPTLQAALQRVKKQPIVFNYVADPFAAGAGKSDADHLPNVTGVYLLGAYDQTMPLIKEFLPNVRTLGTIYVPAEINMVSQLAVMQKAAQAAGLELKPIAANTATEVGDAALALTTQRIDAFCLIPGNLTAQAFPSIAQAANRAKLPVFSFQTSQVQGGAIAGMTRDYYDSGRDAAHMAARVMRGEAPASIPFVGFAKTKLIVNAGAARTLGLTPSPAVLKRADQVIGQ